MGIREPCCLLEARWMFQKFGAPLDANTPDALI